MRKEMLALTVALTVSLPVGADEIGMIPLSPFSYTGVVQQVAPGGVWVHTDSGLDVMLPQGLDFEVGGTHVDVGGLAPGYPVSVLVPATNAQLVAVDDNLCTMMLPQGVCQVPLAVMPAPVMEKSRVAVLKPNGKIVNVPLNAALNMQRAQGARILSAPGLPLQAWSGQAAHGVICGVSGSNLLMISLDGPSVIYSVPRTVAPGLVPGKPFYVPGGGVFEVQTWAPGQFKHPGKGNDGWENPGKGNQGWDNPGKGNSGKGKGNSGGGKGKGKH